MANVRISQLPSPQTSLNGTELVPVVQNGQTVQATVNQMVSATGALVYQGTWNASTNAPTLVSSVGVRGYYYIVSVAGSTNLNGNSSWAVGDWVVFSGSVWSRIPVAAVTTVSVATANGFSGTSSGGVNPSLTLKTTVTGLLKGNSTTGVASAATAGTDYLAPPTGTSIQKANSGGALANAVAGTDYAAPTSGTSILYGNGAGGFSNVTIGSGVSFASGTLSAAGSGGTVTSVGLSAPSIFTVTNSPVTSSGTLTLSYSGTALPIANGGTNATTQISGFNNLSPITSIGDLIIGNGTNSAARLAISTNNGYVLTSNGTTAAWASLPSNVSSISFGSTGLTPNTATSGAVSVAGTLAVANGGTGVTVSTGASSVVLRDANQNITANNFLSSFTTVVSAGTTTTLTVSSAPFYLITGSTSQTFQLPNATTLVNGTAYAFNNNSSAGTVNINNGAVSPTLITSVGSGGYVTVILLDNSTQAGSWDYHYETPSNTTWTTNTLNTGSAITSTQTVQGTRLISTVITGTAPLTVTSTTQVANLNAATSGAATNISSGTTGAVPYQSAASTTAFLSGNTTTTPQFVTSTGTGSLAQAPTLTGSTGSGNVVLATSPSLTTPTLGLASATTINKVTLTAPATGSTLTIADGKTLTANNSITLAGTDSTTMTFPPASASVGYLNVPINSQSAAYTTVLADSGKFIFHPSGDANARTFTIDSNANVAYAIGTVLTFVNMTTQVVTIAITTDTMYLAGVGTTGSRSLAQYGMATAIKMTTTTWLISGLGLV